MCDKKVQNEINFESKLRLLRFLNRKKTLLNPRTTTYKLNKQAKKSNSVCKSPTVVVQKDPARRHLV